LEAAEGLANARGDMELISREMAQLMIMKRITVTGNVLDDDYGPTMIVQSASIENVDVVKEAEALYKELEAVL